MTTNVLPEQERLRLERVASVLKSSTTLSAYLDKQTQLAATFAGVPVGLTTLLDADQSVVIGKAGWEINSLPLASTLSAGVVQEGVPKVITDMTGSLDLIAHPLVSAGPKIRFYAGFPLRTRDGLVVGALELFDRTTKQLHPLQLSSLEAIAESIARVLDFDEEISRLDRELANAEGIRERLEESEARFRDIFQNATDMIMSISADGRILHANDAWYRALEFAEGEISQLRIHEIVHRESREDFDESFHLVMSEGRTEIVEADFVSSSGNRITVEGSLVPKIMDGRSVLARVIFHDITDRKRFELELAKARDAALESARLKSQFLTNVSHEIRTPMNGIVGMLELLLGTDLHEEQREFAQTALSSADALLAIINNILQVSKLEAGRLSLSKVDFDLYRLVERIVEVMKVAAQEKEIPVTLEWDPEIPKVLRGDPGRVRQVVTNLMSNAVKFTDAGTIRLRAIKDRETNTHHLVRFEVIDTGIGVKESAKPRLFEAFTQADGSMTRRHSGVGLGLSTARQLVELMGGILGYETAEGSGSTFWFNLPFEKGTEVSASDAATLAFTSMRVLLIDQSETHRRIVNHYLANGWQMRPSWASAGAEALAMLRAAVHENDPYRIALVDLHMQGMDGMTLARAIKTDERISATQVVLMTALGVQLDDELLRTVGVSGYLPKPVEKSELHDLLAAALARETHPMIPSQLGDLGPRPAPSRAASPVRKETRAKVKILVAEDNLLNQKVTLSQLKNLGLTADAVTNGREVLDACSNTSYALILMDCQMPGMDGYEATMEIRRREGGDRKVKIIAMTAHALEGDREKCLAAGMDDYLSKPTRQEDLAQMFSKWFGNADS